jgi:hypothetical protein
MVWAGNLRFLNFLGRECNTRISLNNENNGLNDLMGNHGVFHYQYQVSLTSIFYHFLAA